MSAKKTFIDSNYITASNEVLPGKSMRIAFGVTGTTLVITKSDIDVSDKYILQLVKSEEIAVPNQYNYHLESIYDDDSFHTETIIGRSEDKLIEFDITDFIKDGELYLEISITSDEDYSTLYSSVCFYGIETDTIYQPTIICYSDDNVYVDSADDNVLSFKNVNIRPIIISPLLKNKDIRIDVIVYPSNIIREFITNTTLYRKYIIEEGCYFGIFDLEANYYVIKPDSLYTKISKDEYGTYFMLNTHNLYKNQLYKIDIYSPDGTLIDSRSHSFKVA